MLLIALLCRCIHRSDREWGNSELLGLKMKTLVFCTAFSETQLVWRRRFLKWLQGIEVSGLQYTQLMLVDDGSPVFPDCFKFEQIDSSFTECTGRVVLLSLVPHLGRPSHLNYPGWFRSFGQALLYGLTHCFDKIVHVESDLYIYTNRLASSINEQCDGWRVFWCPKYNMPETGLQVIAGAEAILKAHTQFNQPYCNYQEQPAEFYLNHDITDRNFIGDRYGEALDAVPEDADYGAQLGEDWDTSTKRHLIAADTLNEQN